VIGGGQSALESRGSVARSGATVAVGCLLTRFAGWAECVADDHRGFGPPFKNFSMLPTTWSRGHQPDRWPGRILVGAFEARLRTGSGRDRARPVRAMVGSASRRATALDAQ